MRQRIFLTTLVLVTTLTGGCTLFRKSKQPKESSAISSEVEENFQRRWIEKRTSELMAAGSAADVARLQAENEFRERYDFGRPGRK